MKRDARKAADDERALSNGDNGVCGERGREEKVCHDEYDVSGGYVSVLLVYREGVSVLLVYQESVSGSPGGGGRGGGIYWSVAGQRRFSERG